jgi:multidrug efflux pump subunit AcrA (membrane-fusion protein)
MSSHVVFTVLNLPVSLIVRSNGKIQQLFIKANNSVKVNVIIAIIKNTTNYKNLSILEIIAVIHHTSLCSK